jgi:hypothetical protein
MTYGLLYYTVPLWITLTSVSWSTPAGCLMLAIPVRLPSGTYPLRCLLRRGILLFGMIALSFSLRKKKSPISIELIIRDCLAILCNCRLIASWGSAHPAPSSVALARFFPYASNYVSLTSLPRPAFCRICRPIKPTKHWWPTPKYVCTPTGNCLSVSLLRSFV